MRIKLAYKSTEGMITMARITDEANDKIFEELLEEWKDSLQDIYEEEKKYTDDEAEVWKSVCSKYTDYMIAFTKRFPDATLAGVAMLTNAVDEIFQELYGTNDLG